MNTPEMFKALEDSEIYMALVGEHFLSDASSIAQWEHAKTLKKPFIILKYSDIKIPDDMMENVNILKLINIDKTKVEDLDDDIKLIIKTGLEEALK